MKLWKLLFVEYNLLVLDADRFCPPSGHQLLYMCIYLVYIPCVYTLCIYLVYEGYSVCEAKACFIASQ